MKPDCPRRFHKHLREMTINQLRDLIVQEVKHKLENQKWFEGKVYCEKFQGWDEQYIIYNFNDCVEQIELDTRFCSGNW